MGQHLYQKGKLTVIEGLTQLWTLQQNQGAFAKPALP